MAGRDVLAGSPPIDTLTEFESFSGVSEESTTSDTPIVKSEYPVTTELKSAGFYTINYSAQVSQSSNNALTKLIVEWRPGTSGTWLELLDTEQELRDVGFVPWSGFSVIELTTTQVFQVRISYANPGAGTALIKQANITIGKVSG
jgi:hypothetical protein